MHAGLGDAHRVDGRGCGALEVRVDDVHGEFVGAGAREERRGVQVDVLGCGVGGAVRGEGGGEEGEVGHVDGGLGLAGEVWRRGCQVRPDGDLVDEAGGADLREEHDVAV